MQKKVLITEDEQDLSAALQLKLERSGMNVLVSGDDSLRQEV